MPGWPATTATTLLRTVLAAPRRWKKTNERWLAAKKPGSRLECRCDECFFEKTDRSFLRREASGRANGRTLCRPWVACCWLGGAFSRKPHFDWSI